MKRHWMIALAIGIFAVLAPEGLLAQEITFAPMDPVADRVEKKSYDSYLSATTFWNKGEADAQIKDNTNSSEFNRTITWLSPTSIRVEVEKMEDSASQMVNLRDKQEKSQKSPMTGKAYVVSRNGDDLDIEGPEGEAVPDREEGWLQLAYKEFDKADGRSAFLVGKTYSVGASLDLPADVWRQLYSVTDPKQTMSSGSLTLIEIIEVNNEPCAVFEIKAESTGTSTPAMELTATYSGTITIRQDTRFHKMALRAKINSEGEVPGQDMTLSRDISISVNYTCIDSSAEDAAEEEQK